jgi:hypothetical protein
MGRSALSHKWGDKCNPGQGLLLLSSSSSLAANVVCRDFDVFKTNIVSLGHIL